MGEVFDGPWRQRCSATSKSSGERCKRWAVKGAAVCSRHGAGGKLKDPDDPAAKKHPRTLAHERLQRIRERIQEAGDRAVAVVDEIMQNPAVEPKDRLKAADMFLSRVVGQKLEIERSDDEHQDLDAKIDGVLEALQHSMQPDPQTGTEG
jgi:hypothetical protein